MSKLSFIIFIILLYFIFEQFAKYSLISLKYNNYYLYGKKLNKICGNEYIEYETPRFHLIKNSDKLINDDDKKKEKDKFHLLTLIFTIIFIMVITIIYSYIIYSIFCDIKVHDKYNILNYIYIVILLLICILVIINPIILIIYQLKKEEIYRKIIGPFNYNINIKSILPYLIFFGLFIILKIIAINNNFDLPSFSSNKTKQNHLQELLIFIVYSFIYLGILYLITNILILYNNKNKENDKIYNENDNIILNYIDNIIGYNEHKKYFENIQIYSNIELDKKYTQSSYVDKYGIIYNNDDKFYYYKKKVIGSNYNEIIKVISIEFISIKSKDPNTNIVSVSEKLGEIFNDLILIEIRSMVKKISKNEIYKIIDEDIKNKIIILKILENILDRYNKIYEKQYHNNNIKDDIEEEILSIVQTSSSSVATQVASAYTQSIEFFKDAIKIETNDFFNKFKINLNYIKERYTISVDNYNYNDNNNDNDNDKKKRTNSIFKRKISGLLFIILIFILSIIILYICIKYNNILGKFDYLLYNCKLIILPFITIFIILFVINSTFQYNKIFYKNIIVETNNSYKSILNEINNKFDFVMNNEYNIYKQRYIVCKPVSNGIISVIISNILDNNFFTSSGENIISFPEKLKVNSNDIICNDISIGEEEAYRYEFYNYIKKDEDLNIFYEDCYKPNINNIRKIVNNLLIIKKEDTDKILNDIYINFQYIEIDNKIEFGESIRQYAKEKKNKLLSYIDDAEKKLKKILYYSLYNILEKKELFYNGDKKNNENINYINIDNIDIDNIIDNYSEIIEYKGYGGIVEKIINKYVNILLYNLYLLSILLKKDTSIKNINNLLLLLNKTAKTGLNWKIEVRSNHGTLLDNNEDIVKKIKSKLKNIYSGNEKLFVDNTIKLNYFNDIIDGEKFRINSDEEEKYLILSDKKFYLQDNKDGLNYSLEISINKYIDSIIDGFNELFVELSDIFSEKIDSNNHKLVNYIINNYNNINCGSIHKDSYIEPSSKIKTNSKIESCEKLLKLVNDHNINLNKLLKDNDIVDKEINSETTHIINILISILNEYENKYYSFYQIFVFTSENNDDLNDDLNDNLNDDFKNSIIYTNELLKIYEEIKNSKSISSLEKIKYNSKELLKLYKKINTYLNKNKELAFNLDSDIKDIKKNGIKASENIKNTNILFIILIIIYLVSLILIKYIK